MQLSLEDARRHCWAAWFAWFVSGAACGAGFTFQRGWPAVVLLGATVPIAIFAHKRSNAILESVWKAVRQD
jgi:hypothetical protein